MTASNRPPPAVADTTTGEAPAAPGREARRARVLLVTGDPVVKRRIGAQLRAARFLVDASPSAAAALDDCLRCRPHLVFVDLCDLPTEGSVLLRELKSRWPHLVVIVLTSFIGVARGVRATQAGAFSFLVKPVERAELLDHARRALAMSTFGTPDQDRTVDVAARGRLMDARIAHINRAARSDLPLLLAGENGTGKELLARAVHAAGTRRNGAFVLVRCGNAVEGWLERDLFGPVPCGAIEAARDATLFVEEIGSLPLRLQRRFVECLGSVRLICTTSCDLDARVKSGHFCAELHESLMGLSLAMPPLGRRREDIPLLISYFLEQAVDPLDERPLYTLKGIELLATTTWPESVRQLFDLVKRNAVLAQSRHRTSAPDSLDSTFDEARERFSREYLAESLRLTAGNVSKSARIAKRNRTDFYKLLARYRLRPDDYKNEPVRDGPPASRGDVRRS